MKPSIRTIVLALMTLAGLAYGCEGAPRDEARRDSVTTPGAATTTPSTSLRVDLGQEAAVLYRRALVRDPAPSCAALTAGLERPIDALLEVVERTTAPASAGMRAAACLVREHAAEIEPQMMRWVQHRETMGFGLLVLADLDRLEPALAERLARAALAGDFADRARTRIARSQRHAHLLVQPVEPAAQAGSTGFETGTVAPR